MHREIRFGYMLPMLGYYNIVPKSPQALKIVSIHGPVMGVDKQRSTEVLLWCATPTCECWKDGNRRYRAWFRLNLDVTLGSIVSLAETQALINEATSIG